MAAVALLAHASPGRTRLRFPAHKDEAAFFESVAQALLQIPGVNSIAYNPRTASVLLQHTADRETIFGVAEQRALFTRPKPAQSEWVIETVAAKIADLDERLLSRSSGRWGLSSLGFYGLLGATGLQIHRGNLFPAAETLLQHMLKVLEKGTRSR